MSRTKLILSGLLAGALVFGTACKSNSAAERGETTEPAQTPATNQGGTTPGSTNPGGTGGSGTQDTDDIYDDYTVPQEDRAGTGGTGYEDPVTHPESSDSSGSKQDDDSSKSQQDPR
jgi:hypothetical protein